MASEDTQRSKPESYATIHVRSGHFVTRRPAKLYDTTHQDWVLLNFGYNAKISDSEEKCTRAKKRCSRKRAASVVVDVASGFSEDEEGKVQTALTHSDMTAWRKISESCT